MSGWDEVRDALLLGSPAPTSAGTKIRVDAANDTDVMPYVVGHRVVREPDYGLDNTLLSVKEIFHLECWGETREQATILEDEVVAALLAAGLPPDPNGPDGLDPTLDVRCSDVYVTTWFTPPILN